MHQETTLQPRMCIICIIVLAYGKRETSHGLLVKTRMEQTRAVFGFHGLFDCTVENAGICLGCFSKYGVEHWINKSVEN